MTDAAKLFLELVTFETTSNEESENIPSTETQLIFAKHLKKICDELNLFDVTISEYGYVYAVLPSNCNDKNIPAVGFIAHMDTAPEVSGKNVKPRVIENYDGKDIILCEALQLKLSVDEFPELKNYTGQSLIVTDGTTLLGADDKAGIAAILSMVQYLNQNPHIKHGDIKIGFTPDEEIGRGADKFDIAHFNADFAYTVDGGQLGKLEYESFNAAGAKINIKGKSVHPGTAKGQMVNATSIACELAAMFPSDETPQTTENYEGFYHLTGISGGVDKSKISYIIRDFDDENFLKRKKFVVDCVDTLNDRYGAGTLSLELKDQYYNMVKKVKTKFFVVDLAKKAMEECGVTPIITPIRGGTDGSRLSYEGLICPNIFTGGHNFHGQYEYLNIESLNKCVEVLTNIVIINYTENKTNI